MERNKAVFLVVCTALISGFAVFANKVFVGEADPIAFSALKNLLVGGIVMGAILALGHGKEVAKQARANWKALSIVSLLGGAVPFALFFYGLSMAGAVSAAFIHKSMFAAVALLAAWLLREKINKAFLLAGVLFFAALAIVFPPEISSFGLGELMIGIATAMWAIEIVASKKAMENTSAWTVLFARMTLGSAILLGIALAASGAGAMAETITGSGPALLTGAVVLFGYVLTFYNGLKWLPVHKATAILLLAVPITGLFAAGGIGFPEGIGHIILLFGLIGVIFWSPRFSTGGVGVEGHRA